MTNRKAGAWQAPHARRGARNAGWIPPLLMRDVLSQCRLGAATDHAFLHIAKTGGTSVGSLLSARREAGQATPVRLRHQWTLKMADAALPPATRLHFILRDPLERYASAFYSRWRKGYPAFDAEWTPAETRVFERFTDISSLFRAVISDKAAEREAAETAFRSIGHLRRGYAFYFGSPDRIDRLKARIGLVGTLENLDDFCAALFREVDGRAAPSGDIRPPHAHRAPSGQAKHDLDETELAALRAAFGKEYGVYKSLQRLINT